MTCHFVLVGFTVTVPARAIDCEWSVFHGLYVIVAITDWKTKHPILELIVTKSNVFGKDFFGPTTTTTPFADSFTLTIGMSLTSSM
jgi:hypothetical protein